MQARNIALFLFALSALISFAQPRIIAHRGYWKCEGSAQNSIASLIRAAEANVYGTEFDVQLTLDNVLVVNHDNAINGVAIASTLYDGLKNMTLANGETLPTLRQYLMTAKQLDDIRLVLEIKALNSEEREDEAVRQCLALVKEMELENRVDYISFSLYVCQQLAKLSPSSSVAYLKGDKCPSELKKMGISGIDYNHKVLTSHPEYVTEAHALGMTVNVWTVSAPELIGKMAQMNVDFITTDTPMQATKQLE